MLRADAITVATERGNGSQVIASNTIPFAVWAAARGLHDYAGAVGVRGAGGDIDTTCAIVGGIVVRAVGLPGIPADWRAA